jgi:hypothetical protein
MSLGKAHNQNYCAICLTSFIDVMDFRSDQEIWHVEFEMDGEEQPREIHGGWLDAFARGQHVPCK